MSPNTGCVAARVSRSSLSLMLSAVKRHMFRASYGKRLTVPLRLSGLSILLIYSVSFSIFLQLVKITENFCKALPSLELVNLWSLRSLVNVCRCNPVELTIPALEQLPCFLVYHYLNTLANSSVQALEQLPKCTGPNNTTVRLLLSVRASINV